MLTDVVFAIWPSLDGKPFRQSGDKYSTAGFCSIHSPQGMELCALLNGKFHEEQVVKRITAKYVDRSRELRLRFLAKTMHFGENKSIWYLLNRTMSLEQPKKD